MKKPKTIKPKHYFLTALIPLLVWFYFCLPEPLFKVPYSTVLLDNKGVLLGATVANDEQWRFPKSELMPKKFEKSILYFEDEHFYNHPGVNPVSLIKAIYQNIKAGEVVRGGSTLSMQVIRLARHNQPRTYLEKLYECILALRLELRYSKSEILTLYAAHAPFGGNVVGLEAASWRYYNRSADKLSWGEAATLAVLPNAPALIFPGKNHQLLKAKRNRLLDKLSVKGVIDSTAARLAKAEPLPGKPLPLPEAAPHALAKYKIKEPQGKRVNATLDKSIQQMTTDVVEKHRRSLAQNEIHNAAVLVVDTKTGETKAYIGNTGDSLNRNENAVDIIRSVRSSGSTLKPFLYAKMQESGQLLPGTLLPDIPTYISGYAPKNFDETFDGAVPADEALARSLNVPAVRMLQDYGVEIFHQDLKNMGFASINRPASNYGLSLILGGGEVTLWDLVENYRMLALNIMLHHQQVEEIRSVHLEKGSTSSVKNLSISAGASWLTLEALKAMDRPMEGNNWQIFDAAKTIGWKTGTSFGHKDAWAIGVTPEYVVGVWVGNADGEGRPGLTGAAAAAPLMFDVFRKLPGKSWFDKPASELVDLKVCEQSGYKASMICPETVMLATVPESSQTTVCPFHQRVYLDESRQFRVNADCYKVSDMVSKAWFVLPPVMEWYYKSKDLYYQKLPDYKLGCFPSTTNLDVIYPQHNAQLFIPRGFEGKKQSLVFEATHRLSQTTLHWHLDEQYIQSTSGSHQIEVQPAVGPHKLTVVSSDGETITRKFEVITR